MLSPHLHVEPLLAWWRRRGDDLPADRELDVLRSVPLVAVAVMMSPAFKAVDEKLKEALPAPFVVGEAKPMNVSPSPAPVPSQAVFLKNSMKNWLFAVPEKVR